MARGPSWRAEAATAGRAAPPLIAAAPAGVTRGGCSAAGRTVAPGRTGQGHAQTMGSERGLGSRPSEPGAEGLAVGAHPRPPARWLPPPGLHWPPTPPLRAPSHARLPACLSLPLASGARRGPASARGRSDNALSGFSVRIHRTQLLCRLPAPGAVPSTTSPQASRVSPLSPILRGGRKAVVLGSDSGEMPSHPGTPMAG